ncbi:hypothetical protein L3Q82_003151 [Scortum barcoo]|uniref:Uncharacterized protein n=1 Tax=Scortum barcoo TaxID=214431 RepID=A0ACB8VRM3_9TELE|nr:hypothetical protein L3Q82_003151 [Scortum barcoo]
MKTLIFLTLLAVGLQGGEAVTHSLKYFYTASSQVPNFPEFVALAMVDELQSVHICPEDMYGYLPSVSLLQKSPSSPVSCHATGFYPDRATLIWRKDGEELHEDVDHGEILPNHDGSFQMSVDLKLSSVTPEDWSRDILDIMLLQYSTQQHTTDQMAHSLKYFYIASSGVQNFPEFVAVGLVDEVQMFHYDSNTRRAEPKQDWMRRVTEDDLQYWERETANCMSSQQIFKGNIQTAKMRFNQTGGVHVFQKVYGCEWDDETNEVYGFEQFGYDGEDFIAFDLKTETNIAPKQQALLTKHKWDNDKAKTAQQKNYLTQICPEWLKKYLDFGRSSLLRTAATLQVSTPDRATLIWRKDGEELHEDVDHGEILPNHDGSFQMSVDLKLSSVTPEDWSRYDCVFHLSGVKDDIVTKLDKAEIRTNWEKRGSDGEGTTPWTLFTLSTKEHTRPPPSPHIGASDHLTIMLMPAYRQRVKVIKPVLKEVRVWPQEATSALQDCFGTTDWEMFKEAATYNNLIDVEEYTDTVTSYITKCIDDVTHIKSITTRANRKPWLTGDVHRLLKARDKAFKAGDESALRTARANLSRGIRKAKQDYTNKITSHFKDSKNAQSLWQGIQAITDYKPAPRSCESDITLLNNLNKFFARFEEQNTTCPQKTPPPSHDQPLCLSAVSVKRTLSAINTRKAAGPDNIPGSVLKDCAEELKDVFTDIFNTSLRQAIVPSGFKAATIIPVPKKSSPSCFNDYRPVALTPIIMKCFERLVLSHIKSTLPPAWTRTSSHTEQNDPQTMQFALPSTQRSPIWTRQTHISNHLVKFADDTTLVGLITKGDETHYRKEVQLLTRWCKDNNLLLNVSKTKEIVVSFQRGHTQHHPLTIDRCCSGKGNSETDLTIPVVVAVVVLALVLFAVIGFVIYKKKNDLKTSSDSLRSTSEASERLEEEGEVDSMRNQQH